jgi:hypothetical protein
MKLAEMVQLVAPWCLKANQQAEQVEAEPHKRVEASPEQRWTVEYKFGRYNGEQLLQRRWVVPFQALFEPDSSQAPGTLPA